MSQWTKWLGTRSCDKFLVKLAAFPLQLLQVQRKIINSSFNIFLPSDGVAVSILMPKKQLDKELLFQKSFRRWRPMPNVKVIISIRWTIAKGKKLLGDLFLMLSQQFFSIQFCHRILGFYLCLGGSISGNTAVHWRSQSSQFEILWAVILSFVCLGRRLFRSDCKTFSLKGVDEAEKRNEQKKLAVSIPGNTFN